MTELWTFLSWHDFFSDFWQKLENLISRLIFIDFQKNSYQWSKYVSLNILWITFMILGLKHNIIAGGQFDPPGLIRWSLNVGHGRVKFALNRKTGLLLHQIVLLLAPSETPPLHHPGTLDISPAHHPGTFGICSLQLPWILAMPHAREVWDSIVAPVLSSLSSK